MAVDPIIKQKAEDIRHKIYGKEVRESLASGLEAMSKDVVEVTDRQATVETQFQSVLDETTGKDVISAPEVILARGGAQTLGERLDSEKAEFTAQLAQKVGNGIKAEPEDLSATTLGLVTGTGGPINLLSVPQDKSVTPAKTTFVELSRNLFDLNTAQVGKGLNSEGEVVTNNARTLSDYIEVEPSTYYISSHPAQIQRYSSEKGMIGGVSNMSSTTSIQTTSLTRFIRVTPNRTDENIFQFEKGTTPTAFSKFGEIRIPGLTNPLEEYLVDENSSLGGI